jgi:hypothetical protein
MKTPLKYALFSIYYEVGSKGIWEYEVYEILKGKYSNLALCNLRELQLEMLTKNWVDEVDVEIYDDRVIRKYALQDRHVEFVGYMLDTKKMLRDANVDIKALP